MEIELYLYNVLVRWGHILVGIAWIGLLYYFNFVQTEYVKVADPDAKADVMKKLAPNALWWFRWAAFLTFLTGAKPEAIILAFAPGGIQEMGLVASSLDIKPAFVVTHHFFRLLIAVSYTHLTLPTNREV